MNKTLALLALVLLCGCAPFTPSDQQSQIDTGAQKQVAGADLNTIAPAAE